MIRISFILFFSFIFHLVSFAQIDTVVLIKNYFTTKQAKKRNTYFYPKTDSMVKPMLIGRVTFNVNGPDEKYPKKTFLINNTSVSDSVYHMEMKNIEKRTGKNMPYFIKAYHKNGQSFCNCKYIGEKSLDTCITYWKTGKMRSITYSNIELTRNYVQNTGQPVYTTHYEKKEEFDKKGIMMIRTIKDHDNHLFTEERFNRKGKLKSTKTEKL